MDPSKVIKGSRCVIEGGKGLEHEAEAWDIAEFLRKFSIASIIRLNSMVRIINTRLLIIRVHTIHLRTPTSLVRRIPLKNIARELINHFLNFQILK